MGRAISETLNVIPATCDTHRARLLQNREWEIQKVAGEGAGKSAAKIRGAGRSAGEGAARGPFLGKE